MKKTNYLIIALTLFFTVNISAQNVVKERFKVFGNCAMCENRIEKAANEVEGVSSADWDQQTMMMEVKMDTTKTSVRDVHNAITGVGHDTEKQRAKDEDYEKLPECCKYDRKPKDSK